MSQNLGTPTDCLEAIGQWLSEAAPEPWKKITIDFEIIEIDDVSEYCIVYQPARWWGREGQFFIDDTGFSDCFFALARLTSTPEKGLFRKCRYELAQDGKYKVDFKY